MRSEKIVLENEDGSFCRWLTISEAQQLEGKGESRRVSPKRAPFLRYRMNPRIDPSESHNSPATLQEFDLRMLVGLQKANEKGVERLIGYGLVPPTAYATPYGALRF